MITSCLFDDAGSVCYSLQNMQRFYFAVRGGKRQFRLAETCQPGDSTPTLLSCAKKRGVEPPRRNCPEETLGKGFLWTPFETEGRGPSGTPGRLGTAGCTNRACRRTFECSIVGGTTKFVRPDSAQSKFPLEISLRGDFPLCDEGPVPHRSPPRKDFCRAKMPCGGQMPPNLLLGRKIVRYCSNR